MFSTTDGNDFPATLALAGQFTELDDGGSEVFVEKTQTINLRIEVWPFRCPKAWLISFVSLVARL